MNRGPRETILSILEIIEYPEDKEQFVNDFTLTCKKQAVVDLIASLEFNKQERLKELLAKSSSEEDVAQVFKEFFSDDDYQSALAKATENTFKKLLETILPDLTLEQRNKLRELLSSLLPQSN